jgi:hypothetical protein
MINPKGVAIYIGKKKNNKRDGGEKGVTEKPQK